MGGCIVPSESKNKSKNQQLDSTQKKPTGYNVEVSVALFSNSRATIQMASNQTVRILKEKILRDSPNNNLPVGLMLLLYNSSRVVKDNQLISQISSSKTISLVQRRAEAWEIDGTIGDPNFKDDIFDSKGGASMICPHFITRVFMIDAIEFQIQNSNKQQMNCPHLDANGNICNQKWEVNQCFLIAGFTNDQIERYKETLDRNWMKKYCKKCPYCPETVTNLGITQKKVSCPKCHNKNDFCFSCLQPWEWQDSRICGSDVCTFQKQIAQAPWDRQFIMYRPSDRSNTFSVKVPRLRLCPRCNEPIINQVNCKHTPCPCTKDKQYSFCYVCLSLSPEVGQSWPCGSAFQYCGRVAENQIIDIPSRTKSSFIEIDLPRKKEVNEIQHMLANL